VLPKFLKPHHIELSNLIRIGPKTDGGYVIDKRVINKTKILITCGLNDDWEFEKSFLQKKPNVKIIAFDHTVDQNFWLKRFKKDILHLLLLKKLRISKILDIFKFINYCLFFTKNRQHYIKKIVSRDRNNKEITIPKILRNYEDVFLKVDIEGDEYKILNDIKKNSKKILFLIIEFHNLQKNLGKIKKFLKKLDLKIIHIHANNYEGVDKHSNPKVIELSLINTKKIKIKNIFSKRKYPIINLDYKNFKRRNDIKIKFDE
jgi:hypothetical protein